MGKHGRYFANPYVDDPDAFLRLRAQVDSDPAALISIQLGRVVKLLQACSENAARLLSVACGVPSHNRDLYRIGQKLYDGELAGLGFALHRTAETLTLIGDQLAPSCLPSSAIASIGNLQCGFRLKRDEDAPYWTLAVDDRDQRPSPLTSVSQAACHCQTMATKVMTLCVGSSYQIGSRRHSLPSLKTFLESDLGARAVLHRLTLPANDEDRSVRIASHPFETDLFAAVDAVVEQAVDADVDAYDELLYGRAGALYTLVYLAERCHNGQLGRAAVQLARRILSSGAQLARHRESPFPLYYEWHGDDYLGAAHGLAGILYVLLQVDTRPDDDLRRHIESVALRSVQAMISALQLRSGNFPTRLRPGEPADSLVQWCHGSPGVLALLCRVRQLDGVRDRDGRLSAAIARSLDDIWARGLLRKGVGLCHGIAGNGYAFLRDPGPGVDRRLLLAKAVAFAEVAWARIDDLLWRPDNPFSLFEGVAGLVCFLLDLALALADRPILGLPGFDI